MIYGLPVRKMLSSMSAMEAAELIAADRVGLVPDPWLQTGILATLIAGDNELTPNDFIPGRAPERSHDWEHMYKTRKAAVDG